MKKLILATAMLALAGSVMAQSVSVGRSSLGSGTPGTPGTPGTLGQEASTKWDNDIYHAPQYMPGYPTAAVLYPRVLDVRCKKIAGVLTCDGYNWAPEMGRGEYLMIHPVIVEDPKTQVVVVPGPERIILKEVPVKKKGE